MEIKHAAKVIGRAWIDNGKINGYRPIYSRREIKRGKHKGRVEVTVRNGAGFRKLIIDNP